MTWTTGDRIVIRCGCVAVVEWRVPSVPFLYAVRIERGLCGARRHTAHRRILAPVFGQDSSVSPSSSNATEPWDR
jgi:hypothetical protein